MRASIALALIALGGCVPDDGVGADAGDDGVSSTSAELQNGNVWTPWTQTTQTWTRNLVRLPGCNGILLDYEWVLLEAGCVPSGADAEDLEVEHKLADGSVEVGVGLDLYGPGDDALGVRLLRLAGPMHGVAALPIAGGTTDELIGQPVFCASYGGTTTMRAGSFTIKGSPYFPQTAYELDVPNAAGQLGVTADRGMPCWNGAGLTGLQQASDNVDYNLHVSLPAARDWIRSLVTPPILKEVNASGTACTPYAMYTFPYTDDGAILNPINSGRPIGCPITRPGTAGNGPDVISAAKVWVRDRNPSQGVCCHLFAQSASGAQVKGATTCSSGVSTAPQQLTLGSIVAPAGYHASIYCSVAGATDEGRSGIEAYRVRLADRLAATAPPASSIKTTLPGNGCAVSSGHADPATDGEMRTFSQTNPLGLVCPVHRTTAPSLTTTVRASVAVIDAHPTDEACCQLLAQRPGAWPTASSEQCTYGAATGSRTLYLPALTEPDPLARFYVSCTVPRFHVDNLWSALQQVTIEQD